MNQREKVMAWGKKDKQKWKERSIVQYFLEQNI